MENRLDEITSQMLKGVAPSVDDAVAIASRYPYFALPAAMCLKSRGDLPGEIEEKLRRIVALSAPDATSFYAMVSPSTAVAPGFYPDEKTSTPTTDDTIDTFLATYGKSTAEEEALLEKMIFNPTPDYSQILSDEEATSIPSATEAVPGSHDDLLNAFIVKQKQNEGVIPSSRQAPVVPPEERHTQAPPQPLPDNSMLSASLAKIFIKQGHYQRAFEIIKQLSLNYPEKSVYFADQLRFLSKLIAHQQRRNK